MLPNDIADEAAEIAYHETYLHLNGGGTPLHATITERGDIECPYCHASIITPAGYNPYSRREEKMIVNSGVITSCPFCRHSYVLTRKQAVIHNHYHFPDDPEFKIVCVTATAEELGIIRTRLWLPYSSPVRDLMGYMKQEAQAPAMIRYATSLDKAAHQLRMVGGTIKGKNNVRVEFVNEFVKQEIYVIGPQDLLEPLIAGGHLTRE